MGLRRGFLACGGVTSDRTLAICGTTTLVQRVYTRFEVSAMQAHVSRNQMGPGARRPRCGYTIHVRLCHLGRDCDTTFCAPRGGPKTRKICSLTAFKSTKVNSMPNPRAHRSSCRSRHAGERLQTELASANRVHLMGSSSGSTQKSSNRLRRLHRIGWRRADANNWRLVRCALIPHPSARGVTPNMHAKRFLYK